MNILEFIYQLIFGQLIMSNLSNNSTNITNIINTTNNNSTNIMNITNTTNTDITSIINTDREFINLDDASIIKINKGNVIIHAYKPLKYIVSSYIIELPTKLVIIDFQSNPNDGYNFYKYALSLNKTIERSILTHYHYDHWNGVECFQELAPIYSLNETFDQIRDYYVFGRPNYYQDIGANLLFYLKPIILGSETIDGVQFRFEKIDGGENPNTLIISLPDHQVVAVGDLVYNKFHAYLAETNDFSQWISILKSFQIKYPYKNILIGHGDPATNEQYQETIDYIEFVRNIANIFKNLADYRASILSKYPDYFNQAIINCPFTNLDCLYGIF
jgi:glyoxylase-like metal-dependent hydrolase (beta-lactamase superfamily II)